MPSSARLAVLALAAALVPWRAAVAGALCVEVATSGIASGPVGHCVPYDGVAVCHSVEEGRDPTLGVSVTACRPEA